MTNPFFPKQVLLALDYDGVIGDSISECLLVGFNAFALYNATKPISILEEMGEPRYVTARAIRNFIRSGEDYVYIYLALKLNAPISNQEDFDRFTAHYSSLRQPFLDLFYGERERMFDQERERWIAFNPLYPGMARWLQERSASENLYIISTKKAFFISQILLAHGIEWSPERLYHATAQNPKREIIQALINHHKIRSDRLYFIDDQVDTLLRTVDLGIRCFLAEWGYNNPEQLERARRASLPILSLPGFFRLFDED